MIVYKESGTIIPQSVQNLLPMRMKMLLLSTMMMTNILSASAGVIQDYPYFSQEVTIKYGDEEANNAMHNINKPKPLRNMFLTFDPASVTALREYIWIDHQLVDTFHFVYILVYYLIIFKTVQIF
jgi:hypothetical protein